MRNKSQEDENGWIRIFFSLHFSVVSPVSPPSIQLPLTDQWHVPFTGQPSVQHIHMPSWSDWMAAGQHQCSWTPISCKSHSTLSPQTLWNSVSRSWNSDLVIIIIFFRVASPLLTGSHRHTHTHTHTHKHGRHNKHTFFFRSTGDKKEPTDIQVLVVTGSLARECALRAVSVGVDV